VTAVKLLNRKFPGKKYIFNLWIGPILIYEIYSINIVQAQVVGAIGCPWTRSLKTIWFECPSNLAQKFGQGKIRLPFKGCSFCDVAYDKGYMGRLP
jgi:hypothetical protein